MIYLKLNIGKSEVSRIEKVAVHIPFSIYLGWITVATIANVTAVLVVLGVEGFDPLAIILTILVIAVAVAITFAMLLLRKDYAYSIVIVWAFLGFFLKAICSHFTFGITWFVFVVLVHCRNYLYYHSR
jgi:hypothetical protein